MRQYLISIYQPDGPGLPDRNGIALTWNDLASDDAGLAVALNASITGIE